MPLEAAIKSILVIKFRVEKEILEQLGVKLKLIIRSTLQETLDLDMIHGHSNVATPPPGHLFYMPSFILALLVEPSIDTVSRPANQPHDPLSSNSTFVSKTL